MMRWGPLRSVCYLTCALLASCALASSSHSESPPEPSIQEQALRHWAVARDLDGDGSFDDLLLEVAVAGAPTSKYLAFCSLVDTADETVSFGEVPPQYGRWDLRSAHHFAVEGTAGADSVVLFSFAFRGEEMGGAPDSVEFRLQVHGPGDSRREFRFPAPYRELHWRRDRSR